MPVLKLRKDDPKRELEFELAYQASLTVAQRFSMMERESKRILKELIRRGKKKPFEVVKRRAG